MYGDLPDSLTFPPKEAPARDSVSQLRAHAAEAQREVQRRRPGDAEMERDLHDATQSELEKADYLRPTTTEQLDAKFGKHWLPARRFGLRQGNKVRPIDDFSACGHNATVGNKFRVDLGGIDEIVAISKGWARALRGGR